MPYRADVWLCQIGRVMFLHFMLMSANSPPNNGDTWGVTKFQRPKYKNAQSDQFNAPDHALSVS